MDLIYRYSNTPDVAADLCASLKALQAELGRGETGRVSVSSVGRAGHPWRLEDTHGPSLAEAIRDEYVPRKVTHKQLAEKYGISPKSVQRILRGQR